MKTYRCNRIRDKVQIDGRLDEKAWKTVPRVGLVDAVAGGKPEQETNVYLLWDSEFLYVAFDCEDREIKASYTGFNDPLYEEDVVEIFIDDNNDLKTYLEFEINPLNAVLHYMVANDLKGSFQGYACLKNNVVSKVARIVDENRTRYEIAIPFSEFKTTGNNPPKPGDTWRFNLYRINHGKDGLPEYSAWCPTGKATFHLPQFFGELIFT